ncbi:MAG TPA: transcription antitermination factor NusB [Thermoanaerobaculia bacterium]|nr:transcription antitermination factor NusB [Thermoanaerobaculia bacterium]
MNDVENESPREAPRRSTVRDEALGILVRVETDRAHAAPLLDARGAHFDLRDRGLLRALVKKVLRNVSRLDHVLSRNFDRKLASLDPAVRGGLRLGAAQLLLFERIPGHAAVGETVEAVKKAAPAAAGLVNAVLRNLARKEPRGAEVRFAADASAAARLALETSNPEWLVSRWLAEFGEERARAALFASQEDSPIDLLFDPRAGTAEEIERELAARGVTVEASPWAPYARTVVAGDAAGHPLVASSRLAVVDAAAQAMCELVEPADVVVDLAASPGGKTRTLLARGRARRVLALEPHRSRASRLASNLAAAGRRDDVLVVRADAGAPPLPRRAFRSVLLDAPCSGTGTLRKSPEIRWRLRERHLPRFAAEQRRLLASALELLAAGGSLTYVTCSLEREENEDVVASVLAERSGFEVVAHEPSALPEPIREVAARGGVVRVLPGATNDGFSLITIRARSQ